MSDPITEAKRIIAESTIPMTLTRDDRIVPVEVLEGLIARGGEGQFRRMLADEAIIAITTEVAAANNISFTSIGLAPAIASTGLEALEIKIVLAHGSSGSIAGERSARTVSQVIQRLADAGEDRSPIVRYLEEPSSILKVQ